MSADIGGFVKMFACIIGLGLVFAASLITAGVTGVAYVQNHDESSLGWFIASVVILGIYTIAPYIICIVFHVIESRHQASEEAKKLVSQSTPNKSVMSAHADHIQTPKLSSQELKLPSSESMV